MTVDSQPLDTLLEHLKRQRGFDFTGYRRSSLERRIQKRMDDVGIDGYEAYLDHLEVQPEEFADLFNTILINVTGFFRDASAWDHLRTDVLPQLLARRPDGDALRVWVAGCASGEEAYTVAIVLAELLGEDAYRDQVKIYANDVDEHALRIARSGSYTSKQLDGMPPDLLQRYFEHVDHRHAFRKDLRRTIIFGRNDLVQDAPISRIDLLTCRNTLMYFNAETQARVLGRLHFALRDDGVLFLGRSEVLLAQDGLFRPIEPAQRTFVKVDKPRAVRGRSRIASAVNGGNDGVGEAALRDSAMDAASVAEVIVDADGAVRVINERAAETFALGASDVGRPLQDLELSYRPVDLRSNLQEAYSERHGVLLSGVRYGGADDQERVFDVRITPLYAEGALLGASIAYTDVTAADALRDDLQRSKAELENAYDELQATVEELETTNEELQSTNEVLETTNEELQSTNGALEAINEELRAANEDLETTNDELRLRRLELKEADAFVQTILTGLGVVVVDRDERIQVFNARAEDLSGARFDDVHGRPLESVDTGLPVERLRTGIRAALAGQQQRGDEVLDAAGGRGRVVRCWVSFLPLTVDAERAPSGAVVLMKEIGTGDARQGDDSPDLAPAA